METCYKNGLENGKVKIYYENGNIQAEYKRVDGLTEEEYRRYYENGVRNQWKKGRQVDFIF